MMLDLRCEMDPRLDYGMIYGVGTRSLRKFFHFYLVLRVKDASVVAHLELFGGSNQ